MRESTIYCRVELNLKGDEVFLLTQSDLQQIIKSFSDLR